MAVVSEVFRLNHVWSAVLVAAVIGVAGDTLAQQPSQAQLNALRSSCRNDYMAHCSSVPTGGAPALNCLKQQMSTLSSGCRTAVSAISPKTPAPAGVPAVAAAPAVAPPPAPPPTMQAAPAPPPAMQAAPAPPPHASRASPNGRRSSRRSAVPAAQTTRCIAPAFRRAARRRLPACGATFTHYRSHAWRRSPALPPLRPQGAPRPLALPHLRLRKSLHLRPSRRRRWSRRRSW